MKAIGIARLPKRVRRSVGGGMNANESRFNLMLLGGRGRYEPYGITVTRVAKRRYTPDFAAVVCGVTVVAEVKGDYRLHSEDRARLAWEIAAEANDDPNCVFVWARWNGTVRAYDCEAWSGCGTVRRTAACRTRDDFARLLADCLRREGDGA